MDAPLETKARFPGFHLYEPRWSQDTYMGRVKHFWSIVDPRNMFATSTQLDAAVRLLDAYRRGEVPTGVTEEDLWAARKLRDSTFHPDTGEKIFWPCRFSAWAPVNLIVVLGMLIPNQGVASTIFWQGMNQTTNVAVNYANRNASNPMTTQQLATGFVSAVVASCSIAIGMNKMAALDRWKPTTRILLSRLAPFTAVAAANAVNVAAIRNPELRFGIEVKDADGRVVGSSVKAGQIAVAQTITTRIVNAMPTMAIPPLIVAALSNVRMFKVQPRLLQAIEVGLVTLGLVGVLPFAIALFPSKVEVDATTLEEQFHRLMDAQGRPIRKLYFYRGM